MQSKSLVESEIWHCPSKPDRELAEILVRHQTTTQWYAISKHFGKEYPYSLAEKFIVG